MSNAHDIFLILNYLSVLITFVCLLILAGQQAGKMQKHALLVVFSLFVCCVGYLFRFECTTLEGMMVGQKIKYSFAPFGMYYMLIFVLDYCDYKISELLRNIFLYINAILTFVVLTLDYHKLFYKSYWLVQDGDFYYLEKEYGIFHTVVVGLFLFYMVAALVITIIFSIHNIKHRSKYVWKMLIAILIPCLSYLVPKLLDLENDFQPFAFAAFAIIVVTMIYRHKLYDIDNISAQFSIQSMDEGLIVVDDGFLLQGCNKYAKDIFPELNNINLDENVQGLSSDLDKVCDVNTGEYVQGDKIYSVNHSAVNSDSGKLKGSVIRIKDITIERNYTQLLNKQNELLENQVQTLSYISHVDELTGALNRRSYEECVEEIRNKASVENVFVWAMDINNLKHTNDTIGHAAGDEIIKASAAILKEVFEARGKVFRTGGDEFYAICVGENIDAEKLSAQIPEKTSQWHGELVDSLSISFGCVSGNDNKNVNIDELMILADHKMYDAKKQYYERTGFDRRRN